MFTTKPKTVASVLTVFTKTIKDLDTIISRHLTEIGTRNDLIDIMKAKNDDAHAEVIAANNVTGRLQNLIGEDVPE